MIDIGQATIKTQNTPNPFARKYILNCPVKNEGKISYTDILDCRHIPMAKELLGIEGVKQVHFFDSVLTITKDDKSVWDIVDSQVKNVIHQEIPKHDPAFVEKKQANQENFTVEMLMIDSILDRTVRPYLQGDGGDIEVLGYSNNIVTVRYQGACGGCPSSEAGTLEAIVGVLRSEFNDEIEVVTV